MGKKGNEFQVSIKDLEAIYGAEVSTMTIGTLCGLLADGQVGSLVSTAL